MGKERISIVLWTTSKCNLKCKYCYASSVKERRGMDFKIANRVLDFFSDYPMKIQFAGGEPMMNYDLICKVYEYVKKSRYDALFQMQTNGTLIDRERAKRIKEMKIAIGVSLDGPPTINEWLRGKTKQAVEGIQVLAKEEIMVNINSVVTSKNVNELPELADFVLYLGNVAGIGLDLLRDAGRMKENACLIKKPTAKELKLALNLLYERCEFLYKHFGKRIFIREIEEAKKRLTHTVASNDYCYASCGRSFVILPNGDIYPCGSLIDDSKYYMGNIMKDTSLKNISLSKQDAGQCRGCEYFSICPGGCPSRLIINKNIHQEETLDCVLKKTAFEIASAL
ncbi:MAG: radical SAM protein [Eubacteriaceae bacterium]